MAALCGVCREILFKYKCPSCFIPFCSLDCFKNHKSGDGCKVREISRQNINTSDQTVKKKYFTEDTVSDEKLSQLGESERLKKILCNKYLQSTLIAIENASDPKKALRNAMKDPDFVEFVDECLKIVEDSNN